jgi:hypothetical protein
MTVLETNRLVGSGGKDIPATIINFTRALGGGPLVRQTMELAQDLSQIRVRTFDETVDASGNRTTHETIMEFGAPCQLHPWPMRVGAKVTSHCTLTTSSGNRSVQAEQTIEVVAEAYERVTVPAGTFDAFRLNVTIHQGSSAPLGELQWWAPQACGTVRSVHRQSTNVASLDLVEVRCAMPGKVQLS